MKVRLYAGLAPLERRAVRRRRLMDAAIELFGTVGFRKTTIPALCRTAGVTTAHFYEGFGTLEALLEAVYIEIAQTVFTLVRAELRVPDRTAAERVRASNDAYFGYLTTDERRARIYAVEVIGVSADIERRRRSYHTAFVDQGARAAQHGTRPGRSALDYRLLSAALSGAAVALVTDWIFAEPRPSVAKMSEHVTLLWMSALDVQART
ncbi:MAG: TetR family transcriptional regulator [Vulcanimicrobiaceae bacterium]